MLTRHFACLAVVAMLCVVGVFMFPAAQGPFQATAGPTTAFRALRASLLLLSGMAATASLAAGVVRLRPVFLLQPAETAPNSGIVFGMVCPLLR